jgi:hypothetical protein
VSVLSTAGRNLFFAFVSASRFLALLEKTGREGFFWGSWLSFLSAWWEGTANENGIILSKHFQ